MSQERIQLEINPRQLLHGRLKPLRAAALAAVLLPFASVAVVSVSAQGDCPPGGYCGTVFNDINNNGLRDLGEPGIAGAVVTNGAGTVSIATDVDGFYFFAEPGSYDILVQIPPGTKTSPADVGIDDTLDSDGVPDGLGNSIASVCEIVADRPGSEPTVVIPECQETGTNVDFGFWQSPVAQPGTATPGYWKTHPEAWPVSGIEIGGVVYTRDQAIGWLDVVGKDKTTTMFSSLVSAKLNVIGGNDASCVSSTIAAADVWMTTYGPVGSDVKASSLAWKLGEPLHRLMDNYNNGMLCAPHRN